MWLYLPPECFRSSAESEASTSPSDSPAALEAWRTSRQILSALPCLLLEWQTEPWSRLLSGLTCAPSTAERGAGWWISSLAARPVRTSPSQAAALASMVNAQGSGKSSDESLTSASPPSSSGKTSAAQSAKRSPWSRESLRPSASELQLALSALQTSVRPIDASASSSWPTPSATPYGSSQNGSNSSRPSAGTPSLHTRAASWPTPKSSDATRGNDTNAEREGSPSLLAAASTWATPTSQNTHSGSVSEETMARNSRPLGEQVHHWLTSIRQGQKTEMDGLGTTALNPEFVEALMNLPPRWSLPGYGCTRSGTASSPPKQQQLF